MNQSESRPRCRYDWLLVREFIYTAEKQHGTFKRNCVARETEGSKDANTYNSNIWYTHKGSISQIGHFVFWFLTVFGEVWRCPTFSCRAARWRGWWPEGPFLFTNVLASVVTFSDRWITTNWSGRWKPNCGRFPRETSRDGTLISTPTPRWMVITNGKKAPWIRPRSSIRTLFRSAGPGWL